MTPPKAWSHLPFFEQDFPTIAGELAENSDILPPADVRFSALEACPPEKTRVVILGQDPYPTPGHANGLAFSVAPEVSPLPRSLANIYAELQSDLGSCPSNGDLTFWAEQGVLLLNTALTVPAGKAGGHARIGWGSLARQVIQEVSKHPTAFLLWGRHAQSFANNIHGSEHMVLESAHPSPLSARRGFFGSRPFSRINDWLRTQGQTPINWTGEAQ
ncbi:uracil-DNA glycosylase [Sagittula sp. SSi028]|uniref:uracil-DNA glycosylase n=1 Tax=Sagittula sp. SSi028 TaxID=3400636 RepID=UPI003AF759FA